MKIHEYQAKQLLAKAGIPVPQGIVATTPEEAAEIFRGYRSLPQEMGLPSAPDPCIVVRDEPDRPQTRLDRMAGNGMATVVGRIRRDPILDLKFVALGHNTIRGAAGGSVLNAELLFQQGYIR